MAVVFGSSGGIGRALAEGVIASGRYRSVYAVSRSGVEIDGAINRRAEFTDEAQLAALAAEIGAAGPLRLCLVASGLLSADGVQPEKTYRALSADAFARVFAANLSIDTGLRPSHVVGLLGLTVAAGSLLRTMGPLARQPRRGAA